MTVKDYHSLYIQDIKDKKELDESRVLEQIKRDYEITDSEDISGAMARMKEISELIMSLIENRVSENVDNGRIVKEYYLRNRLCGFFSKAHYNFIKKWNEENERDAFGSTSYKKMIIIKEAREGKTVEKTVKNNNHPDFTDFTKSI